MTTTALETLQPTETAPVFPKAIGGTALTTAFESLAYVPREGRGTTFFTGKLLDGDPQSGS
jgi:hypothetical protein